MFKFMAKKQMQVYAQRCLCLDLCMFKMHNLQKNVIQVMEGQMYLGLELQCLL